MSEKQTRNPIRRLSQYPDAALLAEIVRLQAAILKFLPVRRGRAAARAPASPSTAT